MAPNQMQTRSRKAASRPATADGPPNTATRDAGNDPGSNSAETSRARGSDGVPGGGEDPEDDPPQDDASQHNDDIAEAEECVQKPLRVIFLIKTDHAKQAFRQDDSYYLAIPYRKAHEPLCPRPWTQHILQVDKNVVDMLVDDKEGVKGNVQGHAMHQSLATALHVAELSQRGHVKFDVEIKSWDSCGPQRLDELREQYQSGTDPGPSTAAMPLPETIVFIMHTGTPVCEKTPEPWRVLPSQGAAGLRLYPCETEMLAENGKIADILTFDAMAEKRAAQGWWRPETCFGLHHIFATGVPLCPLAGHEQTVYKRSWSDSGLHVSVKRQRTSPLTCLPLPELPPAGGTGARGTGRRHARAAGGRAAPRGRKRHTVQDSGDEDDVDEVEDTGDDEDGFRRIEVAAKDHIIPRGNRPHPRWFHQAFVPSLRRGEFRIFIATTPDAACLRGRRGYIFHWVVTAMESGCGDALLVWRADLGGSSSGSSMGDKDAGDDGDELADMDGGDPFLVKGTTRDAVMAFALEAFEALREEGGAAFESLEVGCRIDIGVRSPTPARDGGGGGGGGEAKLFVNEVNRWYSATYFSIETLPAPHSKVCAHFARAFANWVRSGGHRDLVEGPSVL